MSLFFLVRLLHIGAMSVWMGAGLLAPSDVKSTLLGEPLEIAELDALMARLGRTARLMNAAAYLTLATGLVLIALIAFGSGLISVRPKIWLGLVLTLAAIGLGRFLIRPALMSFGELRGRVLSGERLDESEMNALARRFALGVHVESALRAIVLALMIS